MRGWLREWSGWRLVVKHVALYMISLIRGTLTGERIEAEIESKHKKHTQSVKVNTLEFGNALLPEQPAGAL